MMNRTPQKRRSRSESRNFEIIDKSSTNRNRNSVKEMHIVTTKKEVTNTQYASAALEERPRGALGRRKTSAELISEAKTLLAKASQFGGVDNHAVSSVVGGLRLVSTRRPITPREPGRALYGKVALAGRPPSAFSLRYLQNEGNRTPMTPSLEPIHSKGSLELNNSGQLLHSLSRRSHSLDSRVEFYENDVGSNVAVTAKMKIPRKLPSLEIKGGTIGGAIPYMAAEKPDGSLGLSKADEDRSTRAVSATINTRRTSYDSSTSRNKAINVLASRKLLIRNYDLLVQSSTEKLIELLKEHGGLKDCTDETVAHINAILAEVYMRVHKHEKQYKRGFILGGLYGLVECTSPKILLAVARVVLALRVTGSNLTGACKLIFKVARNEQNDPLFHENDLIELLIDGLGRASPLDDPEACIYGYGSVRFLTSSSGQERAETNAALKDINRNWIDSLELPRKPATAPPQGADMLQQLRSERYQKLSRQISLVERLARHGAVQLMVLHLQMLNEAGAAQQLQGPPLHSLYQLSAALRALADVRQTSSCFELDTLPDSNMEPNPKPTVNSSIQLELACPHLIRAAEISIGELEVQANIVRTLSVLSEDVDCCHIILNYTGRIGMLLGPCCENFKDGSSSEKMLALLSRLGYILGNIMSKYDQARVQFYHNDVAMEYLLNVLTLYSKEPLTVRNHMGDTVIDVLIKMIRVVANMSVNSEVGFGLGNTRSLGETLLNLLITTNETKSIKLKTEIHELTQATLGALHNLCFYQDTSLVPAQVIECKGSLQSVLSTLASALYVTLMNTSDEETKVETVRVLGNLTRNERARKAFCKANGLKSIVRNIHMSSAVCAGHPEYDLKTCAIGVLVNLLGDRENRTPFLQLKGDILLLQLLRNALQQEDWFLAAITCQAFWNLLMDASNALDLFEALLLDEMSDLLADYLDEEAIFANTDGTDAVWEEFAVVATDLLERIQSTYEQNQDGGIESMFLPLGCSDGENNNDDEDDVYVDKM